MNRQIVTTVLTAIILLPFLINLSGWNVYNYLNFGERDLILAAALGVSHNAWAEHFDEEDDIESGECSFVSREKVGFDGSIFVSTYQADRFLDYRGFEFPWLLLIGIPAAIAAASKRKPRT